MDFTTLSKLSEDILFTYCPATDCMDFAGNYQTYLSVPAHIDHFTQYITTTNFMDHESLHAIATLLFQNSTQNVVHTVDLKLLNHANRYQEFRCRFTMDIPDNGNITFYGILKDLDILRLAYADPLSHLYNRTGFEREMTRLIESNENQLYALIMIDIDAFKQINDANGHPFGDAIICDIANMIQDVYPSNTIISRIGGDEFLLCAHHLDGREECEYYTRKLCERVKQKYQNDRTDIPVSVSAGIAFANNYLLYKPLRNSADEALYLAKLSGKNCFVTYSDSLQRRAYLNTRGSSPVPDACSFNSLQAFASLLATAVQLIHTSQNTKTAAVSILQMTKDFFGPTHCYISCYSPDGSCLSCTYNSSLDDTYGLFPAFFPLSKRIYMENFDTDNVFYCTQIDTVNEPLRTELIRLNVHSFVQIQIVYHNDVIGLLGMSNTKEHRLWTQNEVHLLQLLAQILSPLAYKMQCDTANQLIDL